MEVPEGDGGCCPVSFLGGIWLTTVSHRMLTHMASWSIPTGLFFHSNFLDHYLSAQWKDECAGWRGGVGSKGNGMALYPNALLKGETRCGFLVRMRHSCSC